jgi:RES domain-containing protein
MEVFRISRESYAGRLSSSGSPNRWNLKGQNVIYAGASRSLSTLELVVHRSSIVPTIKYRVMVISVTDDERLIKQIPLKDLPNDWRTLAAYSILQAIGSEWYVVKKTLILKVPSAVIPKEYNFIINTEHPQFKKHIQLIKTEDYFWDERLI